MDVDEAITMALTWRQFLALLEQKGYEIRMGCKYPTLRPPGKDRFVRFKTLGKAYTPEAIRRRILYPKQPFIPPTVWYGRLHGTHRKARKLTGLRALYYRYLYELGALPLKPQRPSYAVRQDIRNLDKRIRQMEFLSRPRYRYPGTAGCLPPNTGNRLWRTCCPSAGSCTVPNQAMRSKPDWRRSHKASNYCGGTSTFCRQIAEQSMQMHERLNQRAESLTEQNPEQDKATERDPISV